MRHRRLEATVGIGSIAWRIVTAHPKPIYWAEDAHAAYRSDRPPDVVLGIVYERRNRDLPWIAPDTVADAALLSEQGGRACLRTGYYRAWIDREYRRIVVRMAPGFGIPGLMRTLTALLLPRRGGILLRGVLRVEHGAASLVCGLDDDERAAIVTAGGDVFDGFVAVVPRAGRSVAFSTPFHDGSSVERPLEAPLARISIVRRDVRGSRRLGPAAAVGALSPSVCLMDRAPATVGAALEAAADLVVSVPCVEIGGLQTAEATSRAGARA